MWKIYDGIGFLHYGRGVSRFYLGEMRYVERLLRDAMRNWSTPKQLVLMRDTYNQLVLRQVEAAYCQDLDSRHLAFRKDERKYYKQYADKMKLTAPLSPEDFVKLNNYLLLRYFLPAL